MPKTTKGGNRKCLNDVDFPANRQDLLDAAHRSGCNDGTRRAMRAIPPETYTNVAQVTASVSISDEPCKTGVRERPRIRTPPGPGPCAAPALARWNTHRH